MKFPFAAFVAVSLLVAIAAAACPDKCTEHGRCTGDTCVCNQYYEGSDCSIYNYPAQSGVPVSGQVARSQWQYFNIYSSKTAEMVFWMNRTGDGDCDLYVQRDTFPTRSEFLARNISTLPNLSVKLDGARAGTYYAGVYGYQGCSFSFSATIIGTCTDNCNGHGQCVQGSCRCYTGYAGDACELTQTVAAPGIHYQGSVTQYQWAYYTYTPRELVNRIDWILVQQQLSTRSDCDIYVKQGYEPTLWDWDLHNVSTASTLVINQTTVVEGSTYFFGIYGYFGCTYDFHFENVVPESPKDCPNNCSLHNTNCFHGTCICSPGYSGQECETRDNEVFLNNNMSGFVGENSWNYYHIHSRSVNSLVVSVSTVDNGDCDVYINAGQNPTRFMFDYVDISTHKNVQITIPEPGDEVWYIGLYGWRACTYIMNVTESNKCECAAYPNGHGACEQHSSTCICDAGWVGDKCDQQVVHLTSQQVRRGDSVAKGAWNYYTIHASGSSEFALSLKEQNTTGFVWVFVSHSEFPTLAVYDYSDKNSHKATHEISYFSKQPQTGDIYIGVYGSPYMPEVDSGKAFATYYDLAVFLSDF